jgi:hypothetical protein
LSDIGDFVSQALEKYGKTYVNWALTMMSSPPSIVRNTKEKISDGGIGEFLLTIIIPTTIIGITVGSLIPNRPAIASRAIVFTVVSLLWVFLSLLVHFFCKLVGGKESSQVTVSLMVQNLAFVYVASNFLTLIVVWILISYSKGLDSSGISDLIVQEPGSLLFSSQFILLLYFVPVTVSYAHGFRGFMWMAVAIVSAAFAVLFGFPVYAQHGC